METDIALESMARVDVRCWRQKKKNRRLRGKDYQSPAWNPE